MGPTARFESGSSRPPSSGARHAPVEGRARPNRSSGADGPHDVARRIHSGRRAHEDVATPAVGPAAARRGFVGWDDLVAADAAGC